MSKLLRYLAGKNLSGAYILDGKILLLSILYTLIMAGFMILIYKKCHDELSYNKNFNITLLMLSFLSTLLLALVQNNPLLSLGVLGSLSICRIRMNTKDARDLGFVFWALSIGIASAVGAYFVGIVGSLVLGAVLLVFYKADYKKDSLTMVVRGEKQKLSKVQEIIQNHPGSSIQSKNVFTESFELVYELQMKENEEEKIVEQISAMEGIHGVNVLAPETKVA